MTFYVTRVGATSTSVKLMLKTNANDAYIKKLCCSSHMATFGGNQTLGVSVYRVTSSSGNGVPQIVSPMDKLGTATTESLYNEGIVSYGDPLGTFSFTEENRLDITFPGRGIYIPSGEKVLVTIDDPLGRTNTINLWFEE